MKVKVTAEAAESGTLRVWLQRIPDESGTVHAFRLNADGTATKELATATIYGRGKGSSARERVMLLFRFRIRKGVQAVIAGEEIELCVVSPEGEGYVPAHLEISSVE